MNNNNNNNNNISPNLQEENQYPTNFSDTENLIARMRKEDNRNKKIMFGMFILYLVFTIFYAILFIFNPDPELSLTDRMAGNSYVLAFIIGTFYFIWEYLIYKKVDYSTPLLTLLKKTVRRYRFFSIKWIPVIIVVIIIGYGFTISYVERLAAWDTGTCTKVLTIQAVYWGIMVVAGLIGYLIWRKRSRPILRAAKSLLEELKK